MSWTNWKNENIGIKITGAPAVSSWSQGRLDVFVRSPECHLYHRVYENETWQGAGWEDLWDANIIATSPAAVSWGPGRIDLFAVWANQLHHRSYQNGVWSPWAENLEGVTNDAPAAASWKLERVDTLVHTTDSYMSRRFWESGTLFGWKDWETVGGQMRNLLSAPAAVATGPGRIDCFGRGAADHLIHSWYQDTNHSDWEEIDTFVIKDSPAVVSGVTSDRGRVDVFVRGPDDWMKHRIYYALPQGSQPSGDTIHIAVPGDYLLKIARDYNVSLESLKALNPQIRPPDYLIHPGDRILIAHHGPVPGNGNWEPGGFWENIGAGKIASAPAAVGWWSGNILKRIDCFAQDENNDLIHTRWT
jgi:hypothetical protein